MAYLRNERSGLRLIRKATVLDASDIVSLWEKHRRQIPEPFDPVRYYVFVLQIVANGAILLAERDGMIAGYIALLKDESPYTALSRVLTVTWLVDPEFRGQGIGRDLLLAGEAWARETGARHFAAFSRPSDKAGRTLNALGFGLVEQAYQKDLEPCR